MQMGYMVEAVLKVRTNKVLCSENVIEALETDLRRLECLNVSLALYVNVCSGTKETMTGYVDSTQYYTKSWSSACP